MTPEIKIMRLEHENRRLWDTRLCWRNGVRSCDTDRGEDYTCGKPATMLWIDERGDTFYFCGQGCMDYVLHYQEGTVREIGNAHGFPIYEYTPTLEEEPTSA